MRLLSIENHVPHYIQSLTPYVPGKPIGETKREFKIKKVVKLASNENPLGLSPQVKLKIKQTLSELNRYPDGSGFELKLELSKFLKMDPTRLILGNGSNEIIDFLIRTYCVPGCQILAPKYSFIAYKICAQIHGVETLEAPLHENYRLDFEAMLALLKNNDKVRILFLANPNNPTGSYITTFELENFIKKVRALRGNSVLIVLDYAYWEYIQDVELPDLNQFLSRYSPILFLRTFSKVYGLAGARLGYGLGTEKVIQNLEKVRQPFNINTLALVAGQAALKDQVFVNKTIAMNAQGMKYLTPHFKKMGIHFWPSQGNFLMLECQRGFGMLGPELFTKCLAKGLILRPLLNYDMKDKVRLSIGQPSENAFALQVLREVKNENST